jgi:hypothetical protein
VAITADSSTTSASSSSSSKAAANTIRVGDSLVRVVGVFAAIFVL